MPAHKPRRSENGLDRPLVGGLSLELHFHVARTDLRESPLNEAATEGFREMIVNSKQKF